MMTRFVCTLLAAWLLAAAPAGAGDFLPGFDDLPVMPGLEAVDGAGIVFDTPAGRIIEGYAEGKVTEASVRHFYDETLPQLGWRQVSKNEFRREGEQLKIDFKGKDQALTVRFTLSPDKGSPDKGASRGG
jgi:hypothetical protein